MKADFYSLVSLDLQESLGFQPPLSSKEVYPLFTGVVSEEALLAHRGSKVFSLPMASVISHGSTNDALTMLLV